MNKRQRKKHLKKAAAAFKDLVGSVISARWAYYQTMTELDDLIGVRPPPLTLGQIQEGVWRVLKEKA